MAKPQEHHHITISKGIRYAETKHLVTDEELAKYNKEHTRRRRAAEQAQEDKMLEDWI